eukprot:317120-Pyramimonas_sp.AAC.1
MRITGKGSTDVRLDCGAPLPCSGVGMVGFANHAVDLVHSQEFKWQRPAHMSESGLKTAGTEARWRCQTLQSAAATTCTRSMLKRRQ